MSFHSYKYLIPFSHLLALLTAHIPTNLITARTEKYKTPSQVITHLLQIMTTIQPLNTVLNKLCFQPSSLSLWTNVPPVPLQHVKSTHEPWNNSETRGTLITKSFLSGAQNRCFLLSFEFCLQTAWKTELAITVTPKNMVEELEG